MNGPDSVRAALAAVSLLVCASPLSGLASALVRGEPAPTVREVLAAERGSFAQDPSADRLKAAQQLVREGKLDEALAICNEVLASGPNSFQANNQAGVILDLQGKYQEARTRFAAAIAHAPSPANKATALRGMAMSHAFELDCKGATPFESQLYESYLAAKDFFNAGEIANELARVCIESGSLDEAQKWYLAGRDAGLREPDIKADRRDLWEFRTEHALARLAARRGSRSEATKHVEAAKAIIDRGTNPAQAVFVPYLTGYVAFYLRDYSTALEDLQKANQKDPFILSLIAQTHEQMGNKEKATEYYRKVLTFNAHNPTGAFSRPLAKKKLGVR